MSSSPSVKDFPINRDFPIGDFPINRDFPIGGSPINRDFPINRVFSLHFCHSPLLDTELGLFKVHVEKTTSAYKAEETKKKRQLEENRKEQERLRKKLAELQKEEAVLDREIALGESQERDAEDEKGRAVVDIESWKEKVDELRRRSETSLKVMKEMSGKSLQRNF